MYYKNKIETLKDIFKASAVKVGSDFIMVDSVKYPVIDDVIILSSPEKQSDYVRNKLQHSVVKTNDEGFACDIQFTFGAEWEKYDQILEEHKKEFDQYFDIVD